MLLQKTSHQMLIATASGFHLTINFFFYYYFLFWGSFHFLVIGAGLLGGNHLRDWGDLESVTEGMLSESGTLEDYGNPKLITAGLVQWEIQDILDTDTFQHHQAAWRRLCVLGAGGGGALLCVCMVLGQIVTLFL